MNKEKTELFIRRSKRIHGDIYDYSKTEYTSRNSKLIITCSNHGDFIKTPATHLRGQGCPECTKINLRKKFAKTTEQFIEDAKKVHGDKYDYSKVEYKNKETKVTIICPIHGEFQQTPSNHLSGYGCNECGHESSNASKLKDQELFIKECKEVHGDRYDYSKVEYNGNKNKICIICSEHGEFYQNPHDHLYNKSGCPICGRLQASNTHRKSNKAFIRAK